jgi:hypothetical protein
MKRFVRVELHIIHESGDVDDARMREIEDACSAIGILLQDLGFATRLDMRRAHRAEPNAPAAKGVN